jgi:hypothetical protein
MTDPNILGGVAEFGVAAWASKDLAGKLLGPTFDYVGGELRHFTEKCNVNITDVFVRARRKLGIGLEDAGGVSPRVLKNVLDEAAFCEDPVTAEYIAGVLASSRVPDGVDDRGVSHLAVIRELSTYQLRLHYLFYWSVRSLLAGRDLSVALGAEATQMRLFLSDVFLNSHFAFDSMDTSNLILSHAFAGLARHDLIDSKWWGGPAETVRAIEPEIRDAGFFVTPTIFGAELFLWAHGHSHIHVADFLREDVSIEPLPGLSVPVLPIHSPDTSVERAQQQRESDAFVQRVIASRREAL